MTLWFEDEVEKRMSLAFQEDSKDNDSSTKGEESNDDSACV